MNRKGIITNEEMMEFRFPTTLITKEQWQSVLAQFSNKFEVLFFEEKTDFFYPVEATYDQVIKTHCLLRDTSYFTMRDYFYAIVVNEERRDVMMNCLKEEFYQSLIDNQSHALKLDKRLLTIILRKY